jgi:hypothetical protein
MPRPGDKNAPTFDPDKPEGLGRFFERMTDWFIEEDIVDDVKRKQQIVKYLDPDSEYQWKAFPTFKAGTWEEFKAQAIAAYPAAEEAAKGSVASLTKKIRKIGPVAPDARDELLSLIRNMTAEVVKLKRIVPPIHTNRELVELFLDRLTPDFAMRIAEKLSMHRLINGKAQAPDTSRNPEDLYDIEQVMEIAKHTSLEYVNPFGKYLTTHENVVAPSQGNLEEAVAHLVDTLNFQSQNNELIEQRLTSLQNELSYWTVDISNAASAVMFEQNQAELDPMLSTQDKTNLEVTGTLLAQLAREHPENYESMKTIVQLAQSLGVAQVYQDLEEQLQQRNAEEEGEWESLFN